MSLPVRRVHSSAPAIMSSAWQAELRLRFARRGGRTVLRERKHRGPLLVQRPFYPAAEECHVYLLHPPAGIVGGDELSLHIDLEEDADALLTSPAANKFYRSDGRIARLSQCFNLAAGSTLEWLPQETLFFDGARARCVTELCLHEDARVIAWEAQCFGRPCAGEQYLHGEVDLQWSIGGASSASLRERLRLDRQALSAVWGLRGCNSLATLYAYPITREQLDQVRLCLGETAEHGCTLLDRLLVCRLLGDNVSRLRARLQQVWQTLRPVLLGRSACAPRIWAT